MPTPYPPNPIEYSNFQLRVALLEDLLRSWCERSVLWKFPTREKWKIFTLKDQFLHKTLKIPRITLKNHVFLRLTDFGGEGEGKCGRGEDGVVEGEGWLQSSVQRQSLTSSSKNKRIWDGVQRRGRAFGMHQFLLGWWEEKDKVRKWKSHKKKKGQVKNHNIISQSEEPHIFFPMIVLSGAW